MIRITITSGMVKSGPSIAPPLKEVITTTIGVKHSKPASAAGISAMTIKGDRHFMLRKPVIKSNVPL
jgi:hypothetical protein